MDSAHKINKAKSAEANFNQFDWDKSGSLDHQQMKAMLNSIYKKMNLNKKINDSDVQNMFNVLDTNKDGKISRQQFNKYI